MLRSDLERITHQLYQGILTTLRTASVEEIAEILPSVRSALRELEGAKTRTRSSPPVRSTAFTGNHEEALLRAIANHPGGVRSEELQVETALSPQQLRMVLTTLVSTGRIVRYGQARGTRYATAEDALAGKPVAPPEPVVPVDPAIVNDLRTHLVNSTMPLTLHELETAAQSTRTEVRAGLDALLALGMVVREGHGPASRYQLASQATPVLSFHDSYNSETPRLIRRPPRAKQWQVAPTLHEGEGAEDPPVAPIDSDPPAAID